MEEEEELLRGLAVLQKAINSLLLMIIPNSLDPDEIGPISQP